MKGHKTYYKSLFPDASFVSYYAQTEVCYQNVQKILHLVRSNCGDDGRSTWMGEANLTY
jgi:hypothetical protein